MRLAMGSAGTTRSRIDFGRRGWPECRREPSFRPASRPARDRRRRAVLHGMGLARVRILRLRSLRSPHRSDAAARRPRGAAAVAHGSGHRRGGGLVRAPGASRADRPRPDAPGYGDAGGPAPHLPCERPRGLGRDGHAGGSSRHGGRSAGHVRAGSVAWPPGRREPRRVLGGGRRLDQGALLAYVGRRAPLSWKRGRGLHPWDRAEPSPGSVRPEAPAHRPRRHDRLDRRGLLVRGRAARRARDDRRADDGPDRAPAPVRARLLRARVLVSHDSRHRRRAARIYPRLGQPGLVTVLLLPAGGVSRAPAGRARPGGARRHLCAGRPRLRPLPLGERTAPPSASTGESVSDLWPPPAPDRRRVRLRQTALGTRASSSRPAGGGSFAIRTTSAIS